MTIELSEYVIDAIADAVVKKMQDPKIDTWSIKAVADALEKHGLIREQEPCEDAVSRQALYEWLDGWKEKNKYYHPYTKNEIIPICEVIDIIQSLPSATPRADDVLDKIRAEIDSYCGDNRDRNDGLYIAMRIIDEYKAESECEE